MHPLKLYLFAIVTQIASTQVYIPSVSLPGSLIDLNLDHQVINAASHAFYLGLDRPSTYCPAAIPSCPNGTTTLLSGSSYMSLYVEVPGGQQVFVRENGALAYTQAHSAYIPVGSYINGFVNITVSSPCTEQRQLISWIYLPESPYQGFLVCPNVPDYMIGKATYQIYARTPKFNETNCISFDGILPTYSPIRYTFSAWQYT